MKFNKHDDNALQNINFTTKKRKIDSKCVIWASIFYFLINLQILKKKCQFKASDINIFL